MLEAVRTLAEMSKYSLAQLEAISADFGANFTIFDLSAPVSVLVRSKREYESLKNPIDAVTSCARIVEVAEALVDAGTHEPGDFREEYLALCREVDNLRRYRKRQGTCCPSLHS